MDLIPTHHTNEIAQSVGCCGQVPVNYWVHTNMLTLNGQKMSRSLGNVFLPVELFTGKKLSPHSPSATPSQALLEGKHPLFDKAFSPMAVRFFMMQTHYRSTLDFSNEALTASEKGFERLMDAYKTLQSIQPTDKSSEDISALLQKCYDAMNDDFNTPVLIANLFDCVRIINSCNDKKLTLTKKDIETLNTIYNDFVFQIMGLKLEEEQSKTNAVLHSVVNLLLDMRNQAKADKNFGLSDEIRNKLIEAGIQIKDSKEGSTWKLN
jgi:cysteinyl-tRNA synthetase